ncbi:MAG: hypothetical protein S4CHLAM6_05110 [Chlamydiae bacterium]|nr:hypothetical protein [Chlamydiota bacterium]
MLKTSIFLSLCIFLTSCGPSNHQKLTKVLLTNQKGFTETITNRDRLKSFENEQDLSAQPYKKVVRVYKKDPTAKSLISTYHPNGQLHQVLKCQDGQAYGAYKEWHSNGVLKISSFVIKGIPDIDASGQNSWVFEGESLAYDEKGCPLATFNYKNGSLEGEAVQFHPNGQIKQKTPYLLNKIHGTQSTFSEEGALLEKTHFMNGLKEGTSQKYWEKNRICSEEYFEKDLLIRGTYFNPLGKLLGQVKKGFGLCATFHEDKSFELREYQNGVEKGSVQVFDSKERMVNSYSQIDGQKTGQETLINSASGKPTLSIDWVDGKIHGVVRTWYANGQLESQREMSLNKKQGISTAWYPDGSLMLVEEYDAGEVTKGKYYKKGSRTPLSTITQGQGVATLFDNNGIFTRKIEYFGGKPVE